MKNLSHLKNHDIAEHLKRLVQTERLITAEVLEYLKEVDRRLIYLEFGMTSLFQFATEYLKYSPSAAQRRISASRLLGELPEIKKDLEEGSLNLTQVSLVAQGFREKAKSASDTVLKSEEKLELFREIKNQDLLATQKILTQKLDLTPNDFEKKRLQKDESVRLEITLSKEEMQELERAKELLSHVMPKASWAEIIARLAEEYRKRKDPLINKQSRKAANHGISPTNTSLKQANDLTAAGEVAAQNGPASNQITDKKIDSTSATAVSHQNPKAFARSAISAQIRRAIFQRDRCCQHRNSSGEVCGARFQMEIQHRQPKWSGGEDGIDNLVVYCRAHNQGQYRKEAMIRRV